MVITLLLLPPPHPKLIPMKVLDHQCLLTNKKVTLPTYKKIYLLKHLIRIETYLLQSTKCFGRSTIGTSVKQ